VPHGPVGLMPLMKLYCETTLAESVFFLGFAFQGAAHFC
jgi:hypothetical protein